MISFLQPLIPHYRQDFFHNLNKRCPIQVYCYEDQNEIASNNFHGSSVSHTKIKSLSWKGFLVFNPFTLLKEKSSIMVLMLHFGHLTTWFLLFTKLLHRKKSFCGGTVFLLKDISKKRKSLIFC